MADKTKNILLLVAVAFSAFHAIAVAQDPKDKTVHPFLIGGYGPGLFLSEFDVTSKKIAEPRLLATVDRPSFFTQHPKLDVWYCVSEASSRDGAGAGPVVIAFQADQPVTQLKEISRQAAGGEGPCYVNTDADGHFVFVANYGDGSISMFPVSDDGSLEPASHTIQHSGSSANPSRQREPHAHCAVVDPSNRYVLFADLGIDKVMIYRIDREAKQIIPQDDHHLTMPPGSGPRHVAFHPTLPVLYVINELTSTICVSTWDAEKGEAKIVQEISTLPDGFEGDNSTAEILVSPNGKFVFGSNRGHNSIASYSVNSEDGTLTLNNHESSGGKTPRNFRIDPTGNFILAENQNSDSIYVLEIDPVSGNLSNTGNNVSVPSPACIKFVR